MPRILVAGAGIAGTTFAYWATRAGFNVTVVERARAFRAAGQNVDLNHPAARQVIRKMGLYEQVAEAGTGEQGVWFVDAKGRRWGQSAKGTTASFTAEIEIGRAALAEVLYRATQEPEYIFDDSVIALEQRDDGVTVSFERSPPQMFDLVVAADGLNSKTRSLAFPDVAAGCVKSFRQYSAFFTIREPPPADLWGTWHVMSRMRTVILRPNKRGYVHASISVNPGDDSFEGYHRWSVEKQKAVMASYFEDEPSVPIKPMLESDDFYLGDIAQVKLDTYSRGRVVLLGDAGMCPSPYSGMGTSVAIIGAYVLAGELAKHQNDHAQAFKRYDEIMLPFVKNVQGEAPVVHWLLNPHSTVGVLALRTFVTVLTRSGILSVIGWFLGPESQNSMGESGLKMPEYAWK